jgi:hypothetical protein
VSIGSSNSSGGGGSSSPPPPGGSDSSSSSGPQPNQFNPSPGGGWSGNGGGSGDASGPSSLNRLAGPNLGGGKPATAVYRPAPPSRLAPNRDWVISLECEENAVVLPGGVQKISASSLRASDDANPLLTAVRQMIDRRQATVRPGEMPYRPQIRFLVRPEGLRTYYLAYPALENLPVPKTSETVTPE